MRYLSFFLAIVLLVTISVLMPGGSPSVQAQATNGDPANTGMAGEKAITEFLIPKPGPFNADKIEIGNSGEIADWYRSAHADASAEAFRHWDDEGKIPGVCVYCHTGEGFRAFHGLDGSAPGMSSEPFETGGVVDCDTCHNPKLGQITSITMPSGVVHPVAGVESACMTCHQGRAAGTTVTKAVGTSAVDEVNSELGFINPHYATAAATWLGGYGGAGFHYDGREYSGRFFHARPVATCVSCHEPHTLKVAPEPCRTCHQAGEPQSIRTSRQSYDGSRNTSVGIRSDIAANAQLLMQLIGQYASEVAGTPMVYDGERYPYFFADANGDGVADSADGRSVAYRTWTPRMLRTAYNWKLVTADHGAYVHNPPYALELLYDSIEDLSEPLGIEMASHGLLR